MAKKEVTGYKAKELAEEFGITPADLRKHLRALGIEKPEEGWVWPKKTDKALTEIRKQVKARIKELESKPAKEKAPKKEKAEKAPAKGKGKGKAKEEPAAEESAEEEKPKKGKAKAKAKK